MCCAEFVEVILRGWSEPENQYIFTPLVFIENQYIFTPFIFIVYRLFSVITCVLGHELWEMQRCMLINCCALISNKWTVIGFDSGKENFWKEITILLMSQK